MPGIDRTGPPREPGRGISKLRRLAGRRVHPMLLTAVGLALVPLLVANDYYMTVASLALIYIVIGSAFNLLYGYLGMLSFAQVAFLGIGGYTTSWFTMHTQLWQPLAFLAAGLVAAGSAAVIGVATVRLTEGAFAIITLSFTLLCALIAAEWSSVTGGRQGVFGLPPPSIEVGSLTLTADTPRNYYILLAIFAWLALLLMRSVIVSRTGRILIAIRDHEPLAKAQGYATHQFKFWLFVLCAAITGIAGALHTFRLTAIDPSIFDFYLMQAMLIIVILGGAGTYWPVVISAVVFAVLPEALRTADDARLVIYGVLLVAGLLFVPQGLGGLVRDRRTSRRIAEIEGSRR